MDLWGFEDGRFLMERPGLYQAKPPGSFTTSAPPAPSAPPAAGGTGGAAAPGKKPAGGLAKFKVGQKAYEARFGHVEDDTDSGINAAAREAVASKIAEEHLGPGPLKYDVYYDKDENGQIDFNTEQVNLSGSPLTYDIQAAKGAIYRAWMMGDRAEEVSYVEEDGTPDLSAKEAKQIIDQLKKTHEKDKEWPDLLKKNPKVHVGIDKEMSLRDVEAKGNQDQYGIEDLKKDKEGSPAGESPILDPTSTPETRRAYLRRIENNIDLLIAALLDAIAMGNWDDITSAFNLLSTKSGIETSVLADMVGQALVKLGKGQEEVNKKLVEALKDQTNLSKVQELRGQLSQGEALRTTYFDMLREGAGRQQVVQDLTNSITHKIDRIKESQDARR